MRVILKNLFAIPWVWLPLITDSWTDEELCGQSDSIWMRGMTSTYQCWTGRDKQLETAMHVWLLLYGDHFQNTLLHMKHPASARLQLHIIGMYKTLATYQYRSNVYTLHGTGFSKNCTSMNMTECLVEAGKQLYFILCSFVALPWCTIHPTVFGLSTFIYYKSPNLAEKCNPEADPRGTYIAYSLHVVLTCYCKNMSDPIYM